MKHETKKQSSNNTNGRKTAPRKSVKKIVILVTCCLLVMLAGGIAGAYYGGLLKLDDATLTKIAEIPVFGSIINQKLRGNELVVNKPVQSDTQTELQQLEDDNRYLRDQLRQKEAELSQKDTEMQTGSQNTEQTGDIQQTGQAATTQPAVIDPRVRRLAKTYVAMKTDAAAQIMSQQNDALVIEVLTAMKTEEAAAILSKMDPRRAAQITAKMRNQ